MAFASIKVAYVELVPVNPTQVPAGAVFLDETNSDQVTIKNPGGGSPEPVSGSGGADYFRKACVAGGAIAAKVPVAKRSDGKVVAADTDDVTARNFVGYSLSAVAGDGDPLDILLAGPNLAGALTGLGFAPGDLVYMSETAGGYLKETDIAGMTGNDDVIRVIGIADCAAGVASATATDLVAITQTIAYP